jgi:biopolymer transport protein ExbD
VSKELHEEVEEIKKDAKVKRALEQASPAEQIGRTAARTRDKLFEERTRNKVYRDDMRTRIDLPESVRIEKTIFIKAPRNMPYGEVLRVMDGLKGTGADPIGLQLDDLK